jgi:uncharacterized protein YndB with AHSA1/START domain
MTSPTPTGRLVPVENGRDLVLTRTLHAPLRDVWASLTEPGRTARWFGPWKGEAAPGRTIEIQMAFEEGTPWAELRIEACEPPTRFAVSMMDEAGSWPMEIRLRGADGATTVELIHHLPGHAAQQGEAGLGEIGPGWEYYLDMFVAAHAGRPLPVFDSYYPAQKRYFEELGEELNG